MVPRLIGFSKYDSRRAQLQLWEVVSGALSGCLLLRGCPPICGQLLPCRPSCPLPGSTLCFSLFPPSLAPHPSPVKSKLLILVCQTLGDPLFLLGSPNSHARRGEERQLQDLRPVCFLGCPTGPALLTTCLPFSSLLSVTSEHAWALGVCVGLLSYQFLDINVHHTFFLRDHMGAWLEAQGTCRGWEVVSVGSSYAMSGVLISGQPTTICH